MKRLLCLLTTLALLCGACFTAQAEEAALAMRLTHLDAQDMRVGQCFAPDGYLVNAGVNICQDTQSVQSPLLLSVTAVSPDGKVYLCYESASTYIEILSSISYTFFGNFVNYTHEDGGFNEGTMTPMLHYMEPQAYCMTYAYGLAMSLFGAADVQYVGDVDLSGYNDMLLKLATDHYNKLMSDDPEALGLTINGVEYTMGECGFTVSTDSGEYLIAVATMIQATQMTMTSSTELGTIQETDIVWSPLYTYAFVADTSVTDLLLYPEAFHLFMENTTASDQFILTNLNLSAELSMLIANSRLGIAYNYGVQALQSATDEGETYDEDRFTDYIFDQNDYTTSDGSHLKVSTAYDYVYEADNGVIYYTDSALMEPQGTTRLYPN